MSKRERLIIGEPNEVIDKLEKSERYVPQKVLVQSAQAMLTLSQMLEQSTHYDERRQQQN